jgi:hypothetical protein
LRKGSFAAGFLSSSAGLLGALGTLGARHGQSPHLLGVGEEQKPIRPGCCGACNRTACLPGAEPTRMVGPKVSSRRKCVAEALDQNQCARAERGKRLT